MWLYGSGFPKSMDIEKAVNKRDGVKFRQEKASGVGFMNTNDDGYHNTEHRLIQEGESSEQAKMWHGWGTALKPSYEPIIVARKPLDGTCVDNVIKWGVGGINIDECRVGNEERQNPQAGFIRRGRIDEEVFMGTDKNRPEGTLTVSGRFPANTILTYDDTDFEEVCGGFPNTKSQVRISEDKDIKQSTWSLGRTGITPREHNDSGSASRYFMNCKYTEKDDEKWLKLLANNVGRNLWTSQVIKENIAQMNVDGLLCELKDHYAKYVENQLDLCETNIVQDIVKILHWDFKIETSKVMQDFITNCKKCTQFLNLVQFVEKMDSIDTAQTTQNLLKLFGFAKVAITNYIVGNFSVNESDQKRYIYEPKASKRDRDEGLEEFVDGNITDGRKAISDRPYLRKETPRKNIHPTVKPTSLMQYLVRLVTPKGGTILDPFMGSGSTGKAVAFENKERKANYSFIGIEKEMEYCEIARARIEFANNYEEEAEDNQISFNDLV